MTHNRALSALYVGLACLYGLLAVPAIFCAFVLVVITSLIVAVLVVLTDAIRSSLRYSRSGRSSL